MASTLANTTSLLFETLTTISPLNPDSNFGPSLTGTTDTNYIDSMANVNNGTFEHMTTEREPIKTLSDLEELCRYFTPVWIMLGIPGNILAGFVWSQRQMRPSSGIFLAVLAIDELIFLILLMIFELHQKWSISLLDYPFLCESFPVIFMTTQQLSPLLVLGFTVQRYIAICHPFLKEKFCTTKKSLISIGILVIFALSVNAVQAYFYYFDGTECSLRPTVVYSGLDSSWSIHSWITELTIFGVVPLVIFVLNVKVVCETRRLSKAEEALTLKYHHTTNVGHHKQLHNKNDNNNNSSNANNANNNTLNVKRFPSKQESVINGNTHLSTSSAGGGSGSNRPSATTFTLLAVSTYLIITVLPVTIFYVLAPAFPAGNSTLSREEQLHDDVWKSYFRFCNIRAVIDEIGKSHYAMNFYIYLLTGTQFRRQMRLILLKVFCRGRIARSFNTYRSSRGGGGGSCSNVNYVQQTSFIANKRSAGGSCTTPGSVNDKSAPLLTPVKSDVGQT